MRLECTGLKQAAVRVDSACMIGVSLEAWVLIGAVCVACVTSVLYTFAKLFGHERELHDLKVRVTTLRSAYHRRLAGHQEILEVGTEEELLAEQAEQAEQNQQAAARQAA